MEHQPGTITLIGSGELGEAMAKTHRAILAQIEPPIHAVFLDTPAGFEVNADEISARAVAYFGQHFDVALEIASFKSKSRATAQQVADALHLLRRANFIFAGPGSPSYAIHQWRGSAVWDTLVARWMTGAHLVFASAGAIALGCYSLPVYEIYKAGHALEWIDGLDLLGAFGLKIAIIPHWNNAEGGTYDTRFCYMGEERLRILQAHLPFDVVILGIDEHTALTLNPSMQQGIVGGVGRVTIRYADDETSYPAGATLSFDQMRAPRLVNPVGAPAVPATLPLAESSPAVLATTLYLDQLARAMRETREPIAQRELIERAHATMHEFAQIGGAERAHAQEVAPLVELLISIRAQLRAAKQFALADRVREELARLGLQLDDTPTGTIWRKRERQ